MILSSWWRCLLISFCRAVTQVHNNPWMRRNSEVKILQSKNTPCTGVFLDLDWRRILPVILASAFACFFLKAILQTTIWHHLAPSTAISMFYRRCCASAFLSLAHSHPTPLHHLCSLHVHCSRYIYSLCSSTFLNFSLNFSQILRKIPDAALPIYPCHDGRTGGMKMTDHTILDFWTSSEDRFPAVITQRIQNWSCWPYATRRPHVTDKRQCCM